MPKEFASLRIHSIITPEEVKRDEQPSRTTLPDSSATQEPEKGVGVKRQNRRKRIKNLGAVAAVLAGLVCIVVLLVVSLGLKGGLFTLSNTSTLSNTFTLSRTLSGHSDIVNSVAFSPDGKLLASSDPDEGIHLWDTESGNELQTLNGHSDRVYSVAFSPDGKFLASGGDDKTVKLWGRD